MAHPQRPAADAARELDLAEQAGLVRALQGALQARRRGAAVELIETHISWVLIAGDDVYKFKKALKLGFLDYSTLALRVHCCHEELRLNRRLAPALYLGVVTVGGTPGAPVLGGSGPMIDCAVHMRTFDQRHLWDQLALRGALSAAHIDEFVELLACFHAGAAVAEASARFGMPAQVRAPMLDNLDTLDQALTEPAEREYLQHLRAWESHAWVELEPVFAERLAAGRVRECHGDLYLGNVTQADGRVTVFDGIEFNEQFRWIDVISELAFMAMDLLAHSLPTLAHRLVNAYLQASGDYAGVRVLRYYMVHRALVRAKVATVRAAQPGGTTASAGTARASARRYLALAAQCSQPQVPALLLTHGFSGSGKTTLTQGLLEAAGAIRIRADVERKRLAGLAELARSNELPGTNIYNEEMTSATYARLRQLAAPVLRAGWHVILDATFLQRAQRQAARDLASAQGVPFFILDFEADPATLRERIRRRLARGNDASEADEQVLERQLRSAEPLQSDEQAAVFRCHPCAAANAEPRVDWVPLMERVAGACAPFEGTQCRAR